MKAADGMGGQAPAERATARQAGDFAHEFNNILCVINNHANLVLDELAPHDPKYESMVEIKAAARRCADLVDRMLNLSARPVPAGGSPPGNETVLVVDNDGQMRQVVAAMLTRHGYTVLSAATPDDACRIAAEHAGEIKLLLAAEQLPEAQGRELQKKMVALRPEIGIIFITSQLADSRTRGAANDDGVLRLAKPFTVEALLRKIRAVVGERR